MIFIITEVEAMSLAVGKEEAKKWIGQDIYAVKKDGSVVTLLDTGINSHSSGKPRSLLGLVNPQKQESRFPGLLF
jgi:hypothetical protein